MGKKKIIIIDDEVDFCLLMKFYLTKKNCEVSISHTLHDGLGLIHDKHPDIVILDNNLPDGLGWLEAQNIIASTPNVQLYLVSANKPMQKFDNKKIKDLEKDKHDEDQESNQLHVVEKPISISQIDKFLQER